MEQFRIFRFKQVDISLETSDSEPTSISAQHQQLQERGRSLHPESGSGSRSRSKSPRPQTLPGLVKASNKSTSPTVILQFYTIQKVKFLSKNSILTNPQHFHEFFTQIFFDNFSREIKVVNSSKVQNHNTFTSFSPKKSTIFSGNQS